MASAGCSSSPDQPTVLLVDDEPLLLNAFQRSLRNQQYRVLSATSAEEAMQILEAQRVDVLVSDNHMPGMSGTTLLAHVATQHPNIERILLSGDVCDTGGQSELGAGSLFFRFLAKPCKLADLSLAIHEALTRPKNFETSI